MTPRRPLLALLAALAASCAAPEPDLALPGPPPDAGFPESWLGTWTGEAEILTPEAPRGRFAMQLEIARTEDPGRFAWTTTFEGSAGRQVRPYELLVRDAARGEYAIDEKSGVVLEARLIGSTLYTSFEVQGARILVRETLLGAPGEPQAILYELVSTDGEPVETAAGAVVVKSFRPRVVQRALLERAP